MIAVLHLYFKWLLKLQDYIASCDVFILLIAELEQSLQCLISVELLIVCACSG